MTAGSTMARRLLLSSAAIWFVVVVSILAHGRTAAPASPFVSGNDQYVWDLPRGFPSPKVPADNPMTATKVELGRRLFFDTRLSGNRTYSCASCHDPARAFTDGRALAVGSTGQVLPRGAMTLTNVAYNPVFTWGNPTVRTLEAQALTPMFGEHPVELGLAGQEAVVFQRFRETPGYPEAFARAFPGDADPISIRNITRAIASFERTLISGRSPYDRYRFGGDETALSEDAKRGEALFFDEKTECFHCHGGFNFTTTVDFVGKGFLEMEFFNTGLYNIGGTGRYPAGNEGVYSISGRVEDMGRFKAPTLRNVAVTAPYMHDGSVTTLEDVLDHYAAGGRAIADGPEAGDGAASPYKSGFVHKFTLTRDDKRALLEFLRSLTDEVFLTNPKFRAPDGNR
jgi:cytochrome c peroxidase